MNEYFNNTLNTKKLDIIKDVVFLLGSFILMLMFSYLIINIVNSNHNKITLFLSFSIMFFVYCVQLLLETFRFVYICLSGKGKIEFNKKEFIFRFLKFLLYNLVLFFLVSYSVLFFLLLGEFFVDTRIFSNICIGVIVTICYTLYTFKIIKIGNYNSYGEFNFDIVKNNKNIQIQLIKIFSINFSLIILIVAILYIGISYYIFSLIIVGVTNFILLKLNIKYVEKIGYFL